MIDSLSPHHGVNIRVLEVFRFRSCQPFLQRLRLDIFLRKLDVADWPFNTDFGIVPANSRLSAIAVNAGALILNLRIITEHAETARKPRWSPNLLSALRRNLRSKPFAQ